jgi:hypothetical protein
MLPLVELRAILRVRNAKPAVISETPQMPILELFMGKQRFCITTML